MHHNCFLTAPFLAYSAKSCLNQVMETHNYDSFFGLQRSTQTVLEVDIAWVLLRSVFCAHLCLLPRAAGHLESPRCWAACSRTGTGTVHEDTDSSHVRELEFGSGALEDSASGFLFAESTHSNQYCLLVTTSLGQSEALFLWIGGIFIAVPLATSV